MTQISWKTLAHESLEAAKRLKDAGLLRSAASRAYYAGYSAATDGLVRSGALERNASGSVHNPKHSALPNLVRNNLDRRLYPDWQRKDLSRRLRDLQRVRVVADYDPTGVIPPTWVTDSVRNAATIVDRICGEVQA